MKWITREDIRVNRAATCWLVRRFLDPGAEFVFVSADDAATVENESGGIGFDAPGVTYPHKDAHGRCSFTALIHERLADDPALIEMANIVQAADIEGELDNHPAAPGLKLISRGFPLITGDDNDTVTGASFLYEALYASIKMEIVKESSVIQSNRLSGDTKS